MAASRGRRERRNAARPTGGGKKASDRPLSRRGLHRRLRGDDLRASWKGARELEADLLEISEHLIQQARQRAAGKHRTTVLPRDVRAAYARFIDARVVATKVVTQLQQMAHQIKEDAEMGASEYRPR